MSYSRLLRWYPRGWREENGDVFLGMLEDDAAARGATKPGFAEAWSIRVHGLAERASYKVALVLALLALVSFSGPAVVGLLQRLMTGDTFMSISPALILAVLIGRAVGVTSFGFAVVAFLIRARRMSAWPATLAAAAFALSALAGSVEFAFWLFPVEGAAAELPFPLNYAWPASTALFMLAATLAFAGALGESQPVWFRLPLGGVLGILSGLVYSEVMLAGSGINSLAACALVVAVCVAANRARPHGPAVSAEEAGHSPRHFAAFAAVAVSSGTVGLVCLTIHQFHLAGAEPWSSVNLVVAALAPIPTVIVGSTLLRRRIGNVAIWAAGAWCLALVLVAACWKIQPLTEGYLFAVVPVLTAALALFGTGLCIAAIRGIPTSRIVPGAAAIAILGGVLLGVAIFQLFAITPFLCLCAAGWALWRARLRSRSAELQPTPARRDLTA